MRFESHVRLSDGGAQGVGAVGVLPADAELLAGTTKDPESPKQS